jgi:restriction system protein
VEALIVIAVIGIMLAGVVALFSVSANTTKRHVIDLSQVDAMDGIEFEHYAADLMRSGGFTRVSVTKASGEFGTDVVATKGDKKYSVQVKRYKGKVSR